MSCAIGVILLLASAVAQTSAPTAKPAAAEGENAKKARELIDQGVQALGGQAYLTTQNRVEEGRWYVIHQGGSRGPGVQYRQFNRFPDQDRLEILARGNVFVPIPLFGSIDVIVVGRQKKNTNDLVIIHNGDKGYEVSNKGTSAQDQKDLTAYLRRRRHSLEQVLRKWVNDPSMQYFYDGMAIVDGKPADLVTLLNSHNDSVSVYFDQNTHLPMKTSFSWRDPDDKQRNIEEEIYDNYRLVQGVMTPLSITRTFNGDMTHQRFINTARYNLTLPDSTFEASVTYDPLQPSAKR